LANLKQKQIALENIRKALESNNQLTQASAVLLEKEVQQSGKLTDLTKDRVRALEQSLKAENSALSAADQLAGKKDALKTIEDAIAQTKTKSGATDKRILKNTITDLVNKKKSLTVDIDKLELQKNITGELDNQMSSLFPQLGVLKKIQGVYGQIGAKAAATTAGLMAGFAILKGYSKRLDAIGNSFGAMGVKEFKDDLMDADNNLRKLGFEAGTAGKISEQMAVNFGIGFKEASGMAFAVGEASKAMGVSAETGAAAVGNLMTYSNLSSEAAINLAKGAEYLAVQAGVAPGAVMEDVAKSAEVFAAFSKDGGKNVMKAAIQAKKLGTNLQTTSKIAKGLLDFETSIEKEMEASLMIGRQLNFQKARELSLNNDIEGAMTEIVGQLGDEEEFNKLNALQRQALADSIGVGVEELAKFVGKQEESQAIEEEIAETPGIAEMLGEDTISNLQSIINGFATLASNLQTTIGPYMDSIMGAINWMVEGILKFEKSMGGVSKIMGVLIARSVILAGKQMALAIWSIIGSLAKIPFGLGLVGAGAAIGGMVALANSYKVGDMMSDPSGPVVALPPSRGGGLYEGRADDTAILTTGPKGSKSGGNTESQSRMAANQQKQTAAMEKMAENQISKKDMQEGFITALQTVGLTPTTIGESVGEAVVRTAS